MYQLITTDAMSHLRRERLAALEADHWRAALQAEEAQDGEERDTLIARMAELERRMSVHAAVLRPREATVEPAALPAEDCADADASDSAEGAIRHEEALAAGQG